jgi:hypothetical protein
MMMIKLDDHKHDQNPFASVPLSGNGGSELRSRGGSGLAVEDGVEDDGSGNNVGIADLGSVTLGGSGDVGESRGSGELSLSTLDGVSTDGQSLVDGQEVAVLHSGVADRAGSGVVSQSGELGEGQGGVGRGARLDELQGGSVDGGEGDGGVLGNGPGGLTETGGGDPGLVTSLGGQDGS